MTVTVERRTYSCGQGAYELPNGRLGHLGHLYNIPNAVAEFSVHRVRDSYTVYLVIANGRRVDSFLQKRNADRCAKRLGESA